MVAHKSTKPPFGSVSLRSRSLKFALICPSFPLSLLAGAISPRNVIRGNHCHPRIHPSAPPVHSPLR